MEAAMAKAVRFDKYGSSDVLYVADVDVPSPAAGEVVVEVKAAGINPGEASIRKGLLDAAFPATFPSGEGSDLAGVPTGQLIVKPPALSWPVAGSLYVAGVTAYAAVRAVSVRPGETVVVSAAAGGVGTLAVQLLRVKEAQVIGIASEPNHDWLRSHGVTPVSYGDDLKERIVELAPDGVDAFIDLFGPQYVRLAVELGVPRERIETIIAFDAAKEYGTKAEGSGDASTTEVLAEMAALVASGKIEVPIAATYPLDRVKDAYDELEQRHTRGKIVLIP
jgi:NADPH2:quinone reductase